MQSLKGNNFCVETKGVCFFCFHENFFSSSSSEENGNEQNVASCNISLKRLSRYLNVDFRKVFKINIPLMYGNMGTSDVIVPLCGECATVIRKFSILHHELELVKMHLHSCVHTIREKMVKADSEQVLTAKYQKRWTMSNPIDAIQAGIVENLRKETKEKCLTKFFKMLPRVNLEPLSKRNTKALENNPITQSLSNKRTHDNMTNQTNDLKGKVFSATASKHCPKIISETGEKRPSEPFLDGHVKLVSEQFTVSGGNISPKNSILQGNNPTPPVVAFKPQGTTSRETERVSSSSSSNFSSVHYGTTSTTTTSAFASNQPKPFLRYVPISSTSSSSSPVHSPSIINDDSAKNKNQKSVKNTEKPVRKPSPVQGQFYDCVHCEEIFLDKSMLRTHVVRSHCEQFFTTLKDKSLPPEEFKSIVYRLFKDVVESPPIISIDGNNSSPRRTYSCPYCQVVHESDGDVYAHMFRFHYSELTSKLLALQKETIQNQPGSIANTSLESGKAATSSNLNCVSAFLCVCGMRYASKRTLDFHRKYNCKFKTTSCNIPSPSHPKDFPLPVAPNNIQTPTTSEQAVSSSSLQTIQNKFHCSYCTKNFPFYYDLRVHLLTSHRIEEFSKYVSNGVTTQQVHTELQRLLNTYRKLPGNDYAGGCLFCSEVFSRVPELQNHILVGHFDVVVFKLRAIVPQLQSMTDNNQNGDDNPATSNFIHNELANTSGSALRKPVFSEMGENADSIMLKQDIASLDSATGSMSTLELIVPTDPLSLDFMEVDVDPGEVLCQEEDQLKMEWLFSFIDDGSEVQTQESNQQQIVEDEKGGFLLGNIDTELILP